MNADQTIYCPSAHDGKCPTVAVCLRHHDCYFNTAEGGRLVDTENHEASQPRRRTFETDYGIEFYRMPWWQRGPSMSICVVAGILLAISIAVYRTYF
jgi:hypothetical protein